MEPNWKDHLLFVAGMVCLMFLIFKAVPAKGENELWVNLGGPSRHIDRNHEHNEKNYGLGLHYKVSDNWGLAGGFYRNSLANTTYYAAAPYMPLRYGPMSAGLTLGVLAGGYRVPWAPYALPSARLEFDKYAVNVIYVPKLDKYGREEVWWLNLEIRLK